MVAEDNFFIFIQINFRIFLVNASIKFVYCKLINGDSGITSHFAIIFWAFSRNDPLAAEEYCGKIGNRIISSFLCGIFQHTDSKEGFLYRMAINM